MYRLGNIFAATLLSISSLAISATNDLKSQYEDFQKTYSQTLSAAKNKSNFAKEFDQNNKKLKIKYDQFVKFEKKELSPEGNQMALDIEMLEPLEFLATSRINKEACSEAMLLNEMNSTSDPETFVRVKKSIQTLCN